MAIDQERNAIIVGSKEDSYKEGLIANELSWVAWERLAQPMKVKAKIRYRHQGAQATVTPLDRDKVQVRFQEPQMAPTPGQAVVFYNGDSVLGGGTIAAVAG